MCTAVLASTNWVTSCSNAAVTEIFGSFSKTEAPSCLSRSSETTTRLERCYGEEATASSLVSTFREFRIRLLTWIAKLALRNSQTSTLIVSGTWSEFIQGRQAPIVFFSMATSSGEDVPRNLAVLFSRNRSMWRSRERSRLAYLVCSPRLLEARYNSIEEMDRSTHSAASRNRHSARLLKRVRGKFEALPFHRIVQLRVHQLFADTCHWPITIRDSGKLYTNSTDGKFLFASGVNLSSS